jgi:hypothetical protein
VCARRYPREALEQQRLLARRQPGAFVEDGEPGLRAVTAPVDLDARRRVAQRVLDQVVEQDGEILLRGGDRRVAVPDELERSPFVLGAGRPAFLRAFRRSRQRDRPARSGPVALACERQEGAQQPGEPLDLALGRLEVRPCVRAALGASRLEPETQPGERRAQLVRGVGDELTLGG